MLAGFFSDVLGDNLERGRRFLRRALHILLAATLAAQAAGPQPSPANLPEPKPSFPSGETLFYSISWRVFTAGEASMRIEHQALPGASSSWRATVRASSTGFVSKLYKVDDTLISTFANGRMCSQSLLKILHEGRRHRSIQIDFVNDRRTAALKETDLARNQSLRQAENAIPECAYDVVSALFYVRSIPLEVGSTFEVPVNDGSQTLPIAVEVQAREEVKTNAGNFRAIRVEPKVFGGSMFRRSGRMLLWFSDDSQRLLVQLKAKLFVGTITAVLERAERPPAPR